MPAPSPDGFTRSIGGLLLDPGGAILACIVTTDYESFHSALRPIPDIAVPMSGGEIPAAYQGNFWITGLARAPSGAIYACDADGSVHDNATGPWRVTALSPGQGLRAIACLGDGTVLTGGTSGVVYRSLPDGGFEALEPAPGQWINAFAGKGRDDFVVVADGGTAVRWDGGGASSIDLATDATLHDVLLDGSTYLIAGPNGLLFRGAGEVWEDISRGSDAYFELARYHGKLWAAAGPGGVLDLTDAGAEPVRQTFNAYRIRTAGRFAAFAGDNLVVRHDGEVWSGYKFG